MTNEMTFGMTFKPTLPARGSDDPLPADASHARRFKPTLPARGSDENIKLVKSTDWKFKPTLPARGSDHVVGLGLGGPQLIQTHAPREGERPGHIALGVWSNPLKPTLPARGSDVPPP